MLNLIAQATQPTGGFMTWSVTDWILLLGAIGALIATWRRAGDAKVIAHEAKESAAESYGIATTLKGTPPKGTTPE